MRRGVFDVLRRGLDNTIANWQLILLRLAETVLFLVIAIAGLLAILAPILLSLGIDVMNLTTPEQVESALATLATRWMVIVWVVLAVSVLMAVFVALHSFLEAGSARVYVDAERVAGPAVDGPRSRFAVFSFDRWIAGGVDGWWTVFWIYNLAWALASALLLVPLLPTVALMAVLRPNDGAVIAVGCVGLLATLAVMIVVLIATTMWTNRAIAGWAIRRSGARDALAASWHSLRADFGRHVLIALSVFGIAIAGSSFFGSLSMFAAMGETVSGGTLFFITLPIRIVGTLLSSAFSAAVSAWFLASYAALTTE